MKEKFFTNIEGSEYKLHSRRFQILYCVPLRINCGNVHFLHFSLDNLLCCVLAESATLFHFNLITSCSLVVIFSQIKKKLDLPILVQLISNFRH